MRMERNTEEASLEPRTHMTRDPGGLAAAILVALLPGSTPPPAGLDDAIRLELLITALQDGTCPRSISDLVCVLERISVGEVAQAFVGIVRERAEEEPDLPLTELAARAV